MFTDFLDVIVLPCIVVTHDTHSNKSQDWEERKMSFPNERTDDIISWSGFCIGAGGAFYSAVAPEDIILRGSQHRTMSGRVTLENVRAWDETLLMPRALN